MLIFNLSAISRSDKILNSEVHIYKRKTKEGRDHSILMEMHELAPSYVRRIDHRRIPAESYGWQATEVGAAVRACVHRRNNVPHFLAVTFHLEKGDASPPPMSPRAFRRRLSLPYLIVFSNDSQVLTMDHIAPHLNPIDFTEQFVDPESGTRDTFRDILTESRRRASSGRRRQNGLDMDSQNKPRSSRIKEESRNALNSMVQRPGPPIFPGGFRLQKTSPFALEKGHNEVRHRKRRSIFDNEIPEFPTDTLAPPSVYQMPQTHPTILQGRTKMRQKVRDSKLIPYPEDYKRRRRRKKNRRRKNRRRNSSPVRLEEDTVFSWHINNIISPKESSQLCSKRKLQIDFADIGWNEWIISPKSFEANYCVGRCPFPLSQVSYWRHGEGDMQSDRPCITHGI